MYFKFSTRRPFQLPATQNMQMEMINRLAWRKRIRASTQLCQMDQCNELTKISMENIWIRMKAYKLQDHCWLLLEIHPGYLLFQRLFLMHTEDGPKYPHALLQPDNETKEAWNRTITISYWNEWRALEQQERNDEISHKNHFHLNWRMLNSKVYTCIHTNRYLVTCTFTGLNII